MRRRKRRWRRRRKEEEEEEEEKEITTPMQSFAAMQHSLLMSLGYCVLHIFLVNKLEEEEIDEELAVLCSPDCVTLEIVPQSKDGDLPWI